MLRHSVSLSRCLWATMEETHSYLAAKTDQFDVPQFVIQSYLWSVYRTADVLLLKQLQKPLCNDKALEKREAFFPLYVCAATGSCWLPQSLCAMFCTFDFHTKKASTACLSCCLFPPSPYVFSYPPPSLSSSPSFSHSCLLALLCSVIPPVSRNAVVFNFFQLLWHCARPPAFPHLLPVMPHKHGQHIKTAGSQPSAWPSPGTPNQFIHHHWLLKPSVTGKYTVLKHLGRICVFQACLIQKGVGKKNPKFCSWYQNFRETQWTNLVLWPRRLVIFIFVLYYCICIFPGVLLWTSQV